MKLFLIPITKRRTLIYAQQLRVSRLATEKPSILDRATTKAAITWQEWEHGDKKWQRSLVDAGNKLLRRIPYEEWGLKSIPTLSSRKQEAELQEKKIAVIYPPSLINGGDIPSIIQQLATERAALHRTRFWWSVIGMPIVVPFALVPIIPNIPFFYLAFRAYSHWKALKGGEHLEFLLKNNLLAPVPSPELDTVYKKGQNPGNDKPEANVPSKDNDGTLLINDGDAQTIGNILQVPELAGELERAQSQVQAKILEANQSQLQPKKEI